MSKPGKRGGYSVGFGKPPEQHRFKKGQSGNPKGRSKKAKVKEPPPKKFGEGYLKIFLQQEAFRDLQLHENGKPVTLSAVQAILRSLLLDGVKGNRLAKRQAYELLMRTEREAAEKSVESYQFWAAYKADKEMKIQKCRKEGSPAPQIYPHPDDILLDEANVAVHFLGPQSADQAIPYIRTALMRDWCLARLVQMGRYRKRSAPAGEGDPNSPTAEVIPSLIERTLPPSFQRSDSETTSFVMGLTSLGKRQLRKQMDAIMREASGLPLTVEERLEERRKSSMLLETLGATFEKVAEILLKKENQPA